jgi:hypothetical protein
MTLRAIAALALAALAVHEARYLLVPDGHAEAGHGYLVVAPGALGLLLAVAAGRSLGALGRRAPRGRGVTWAAATASLVAIHAGQEVLERLLAGGGPLDAGVLLVVPLCAVAGAAVAVALRRAEQLLVDAVAPARAPRARLAVPVQLAPRAPAFAVVAAGLARHLAGRAPPAFG